MKSLLFINKKGLTIPFIFTNSNDEIFQPCVTVLLFPMATREDLNSSWIEGLGLFYFRGTLCSVKDLSS